MVEKCFKGAKVLDGSAVKFGRSRQDAAEMLVRRFGNNASGVCGVQWKTGGGHAFNWQIKNGVVSFFDGQAGKDDSFVSRVYWKDLIMLRLIWMQLKNYWNNVKNTCSIVERRSSAYVCS